MTAPNDPSSPSPSRIISTVLSPAVRLWLRSQLDHTEDLQLKIEASDRQIFAGTVRQVTVSARKAIYQGLHLSQVELTGQNIQTNLRQMLRGKAFRLLEAFPVAGVVVLQEADVNESLQAPLLGNAVIEFLLTLLKGDLDEDLAAGPDAIVLKEPQVRLELDRITFIAGLVAASGKVMPVVLRTGLQLQDGHLLKLDRPQWLPHANARQGLPLHDLDGFTFDLGEQVKLEELTLHAGQIVCQGQILVIPD